MLKTPRGSCESDEADKVENLIHNISHPPSEALWGLQQVCHGSVKGKTCEQDLHSIIGERWEEVMNGNQPHPPENQLFNMQYSSPCTVA